MKVLCFHKINWISHNYLPNIVVSNNTEPFLGRKQTFFEDFSCYEIVDHVVSNFAKYDNDRTKAKLKAVAENHKLYPLGDDDSLYMSLTVADAYINDHNQKDDKYSTLNQVIRNLAVDVLNDMADDNLDHEAVKQKRPNKKLSK